MHAFSKFGNPFRSRYNQCVMQFRRLKWLTGEVCGKKGVGMEHADEPCTNSSTYKRPFRDFTFTSGLRRSKYKPNVVAALLSAGFCLQKGRRHTR